MKTILVYSATKLDSPSWAGAVEKDIGTVFPKEHQAMYFTHSADVLTDGQFQDMKSGVGYLYVRAWATYGMYHTQICIEAKLKKSLTGQLTGEIQNIANCTDSAASSAS